MKDSIMRNVKLMKVFFTVIAFVDLLLSIRKEQFLGFSVLQVVVVIIWFIGLLNGIGYFSQTVPMLPITIVRILEIIFYGLIRGNANWLHFALMVILDVLFMAFLYADKIQYEYIYEEEVEEDVK